MQWGPCNGGAEKIRWMELRTLIHSILLVGSTEFPYWIILPSGYLT